MFNLKAKTPLLSLNLIMSNARDTGGSEYDPTNTLWYLENDSQLAIMVHPAYGMVFYNDEMHVIELCSSFNDFAVVECILNDYGLVRDSEVWLEIGIDQVDYHFVS